MKKRMTIVVALLLILPLMIEQAWADGMGGYNGYWVKAPLVMRLSTRTGPGTWYDEPGTFFNNNYRETSVQVLSKAWDNRNEIWWLQVEFYVNNTPYRAYTGLKRVDVDISYVPEERPMGTAYTLGSEAGYWGPGTQYASSRYDIPAGISVTVMAVENNYAQVEFYDGRTADRDYARRRAWIRTSSLSGFAGGSSGTPGTNPQPPKQNGVTGTIPQLPPQSGTLQLKNYNVERITPQCGPGYNFRVFASMDGNTRLYKPREIRYLAARFCVNDWVYVEFGYGSSNVCFGFFEKSLFDCPSGWNSVPDYSLNAERPGYITVDTTPNNGPTTNSGSYSSCRLSPGTTVNACMEYNGWYLCRFYNDHSNCYGDVYLWVTGSSIAWR